MKEAGKHYKVNKLFSLVVDTAGTEKTSKDRLSVKGQRFLSVFLSERYKFERFQDSRKPKQQN
jgi:hypothetical protein